MTSKLGVIGHPISHSISPAFQQAALDAAGVDARFEAWETPPERLAARIQSMRTGDILGASVTIPHKEAAVALMDDVTGAAEAVGAVNCVVVSNGRLIGHNTDGLGFIAALRECAGFSPAGKRVLLIGAGGAARALAHALVDVDGGLATLTIANRTLCRAEALIHEIGGAATQVTAIGLGEDELAGPTASADLIVNSTSLGMTTGDGSMCSPIPKDLIPASALVNDIVYSPPETPLLVAARERGASVLGGLPMLIYQGAAAFELWTGRPAPVEVMFRAGEAALGPAR